MFHGSTCIEYRISDTLLVLIRAVNINTSTHVINLDFLRYYYFLTQTNHMTKFDFSLDSDNTS